MISTAPPLLVRYGLAWILVANAADLALTLWGVNVGVISEGNPIMARVLQATPAGLIVLKVALVVGGTLALYWAYPRRPRFTGGAIGFLTLVMGAVMGMHVAWVFR